MLFPDACVTLDFAVHRERRSVPAPGAVYLLYRLWHSRSGHALCSVLLQNKVRASVWRVCYLASVLLTALQRFGFSPPFEAVVISGQARTVPRGCATSVHREKEPGVMCVLVSIFWYRERRDYALSSSFSDNNNFVSLTISAIITFLCWK